MVQKLIKDVEVTIIEDCGHVVTLEQPRLCSRLIIKHVESLTKNANGSSKTNQTHMMSS